MLLVVVVVVLNELSVLYLVLDWMGTNLEVAVIEVELNGTEFKDDGNISCWLSLFLLIAEKFDFIIVERDLCWFWDGDNDWLFEDDTEDDDDDDDDDDDEEALATACCLL